MAASQKDVKAGGAFVEISARDKTSAAFAAMRDRLQSLGKIIAGVGAIGTTAFLPFLKAGVDRAVEIDRLASELGFATEEMQRFKYAADVAGVSVQDIIKNPEKFKDLLADAPLMDAQTIKDSVEANRAFKKSLIEIQTALTPLISLFSGILKFFAELVKNNKVVVRSLAILSGAFVAVGVTMTVVFAKWLIIPALIIGAVVAFVRFTDAGKRMQEEFGKSVGLIIDKIQSGDLEGAFTILTASLEYLWKKLTINMKMLWAGVVAYVKEQKIDTEAVADSWATGVAAWGLRNRDLIGKIVLGPIGGEFLKRKDPLGLKNVSDQDINKGRDDVIKNIEKDRLEKQKKLDDEFVKQLADLERELQNVKDKFKQSLDGAEKESVKPNSEYGSMQIESVRGAFRLGNNASQQFGEGTNFAKKQIDLAEKQVELAEQVVVEIQRLAKGLAFQ